MAWFGRAVTIAGVLLVAAPLVGIGVSFVDISIPWVVEYGPTFILGGIFLFVLGIGLQTFGR